MINRIEFLKQMGIFNFDKYHASDQGDPVKLETDHIEQQVDVDKLETLICLESLLAICYQSIAGMVHNQTIRKECQQFEQHIQYHQEELKKMFPLSQKSEAIIEDKVYKHVLQLKPRYLSLNSVINLSINLTAFKINIYRYFSHTVQKHSDLLNNFLEDNIEEMDFLCQEKKFHQNRVHAYSKI